ncbi:MAG: AbrB family transcriptional regulator [Pseudomonadota bacterium]
MLASPTLSSLRITAQSLAIGAVGAGLAEWLSLPIAVLTGPAILVSLAALLGVRTGLDTAVRDILFLVIGVSIGSGVDTNATGAMLRWPLAFAALAVMLVLTLWLCGRLLEQLFQMDRRSAFLAAAPGHLSFVVGLSSELGLDTTRVVVVQSVRVLALTLSVPALAWTFGVDLDGAVLRDGARLSWSHFARLLVVGGLIGWVLMKLRLPAPLLIGGMIASSAGHGSGLTPGLPPPWLAYAALLAVGTLIGSRFDGMTRAALLHSLLAGLMVTFVCVAMALAAAAAVAAALGFDTVHVLVAFSPGGLETMIAMGVILGANPGFVAASHVARLLFLTVLLPAFVGRLKQD